MICGDISKLSQISLAQRLVKLRYNNSEIMHSWHLCQISLQIMLLPVLINHYMRNFCNYWLEQWYFSLNI